MSLRRYLSATLGSFLHEVYLEMHIIANANLCLHVRLFADIGAVIRSDVKQAFIRNVWLSFA